MSLFWGRRVVDDVEDELAFHRDMRIQEYLARGMTEAEARAAAAARLGDLAAPRAACLTIGQRRTRRMRRTLMLDALRQDFAFALRMQMRQPLWTAVAILTLALGIGATTAVYSMINSLLVHPLPYPGGTRMMLMNQKGKPGTPFAVLYMAPPLETVDLWRRHARLVEEIAVWQQSGATLRLPGIEDTTVQAAAITPAFIALTALRTIRGRAFDSTDAVAGAAPVVLVSETTWRQRFGQDPGILGRSVTLNGQPYQIIGVTRRGTRLPRETVTPEFWFPLIEVSGRTSAIARLAPGATLVQATAELDTLEARSDLPPSDFTVHLTPPAELVSFRDSLQLLGVAVTLVLLIACANVAHLLLARGAARERELAIRASLGAGRGRLLRQLLTESLLLTGIGSAAGLALGWAGLRLILKWRPESLNLLTMTRLDGTIVAGALLLALVTGTLFGMIGLVQLRRRGEESSLHSSARSSSASHGQQWFRGALLLTEVALSTALLVSATLLVRSMLHIQRTDPGFVAEGLYATTAGFPGNITGAERRQFYQELQFRAVTIPGVSATALASNIPPDVGVERVAIEIGGAVGARPEPEPILSSEVSRGYFDVMKIPLLAGTSFTDTSVTSDQVVISQAMAEAKWPGQNAVGRRFRLGDDGPWRTVTGIARNVLANGPLEDHGRPHIYFPIDPSSTTGSRLMIFRYSGSGSPARALRAQVPPISGWTPPAAVTDVAATISQIIELPRFITRMLLIFTLLAIILVAVGLYGVMAYTVAQRTRDIGIRVALGATRRQVLRNVMGSSVILAAGGVGLGLLLAWWGGSVMQALLHGVTRGDPVSFAIGAAVLGVAALAACLVPARRALAIDPVVAIRME